jgi:hypothetical protein
MTLEELEEIYMNGFADEVTGDVDTFGHYYRVGRFIVMTDGFGFHYREAYGTEQTAIDTFRRIDDQYSESENDE